MTDWGWRNEGGLYSNTDSNHINITAVSPIRKPVENQTRGNTQNGGEENTFTN